ncbi:hypothetical protein C9374_000499 [Naegleria lovaniensis]|uniref:FH2 domain-containing protein n=1 Tax=Naegleria lovaniensis TaxID=51637 RepID=A0AA88GWM2_NAELO|nr:uncharacterized protein C9374_000499 [Naegleria lovaniensis]KAG2388335.1 hypothetical protein C9374_000499 [Naegleria lovaniensis]
MFKAIRNYFNYNDLIDININERLKYIHNENGTEELNLRISNLLTDKYEDKVLIFNFTSKPFPSVATRPCIDIGSTPVISEHFEQIPILLSLSHMIDNYLLNYSSSKDYYVVFVASTQTVCYALLLASVFVSYTDSKMYMDMYGIEQSSLKSHHPERIITTTVLDGSTVPSAHSSPNIHNSNTSSSNNNNNNNNHSITTSDEYVFINEHMSGDPNAHDTNGSSSTAGMGSPKLSRTSIASASEAGMDQAMAAETNSTCSDRTTTTVTTTTTTTNYSTRILNTVQILQHARETVYTRLEKKLNAKSLNKLKSLEPSVFRYANLFLIALQRPLSLMIIQDHPHLSISSQIRTTYFKPSCFRLQCISMNSSRLCVKYSNNGMIASFLDQSNSTLENRRHSMSARNLKREEWVSVSKGDSTDDDNIPDSLVAFQYRKLYFVVRKQTDILFSTFTTASTNNAPRVERRKTVLSSHNPEERPSTRVETWFHYNLPFNESKPLMGDFILLAFTMADDGNIISLFRFTFNTMFLTSTVVVVDKSELDWAHNSPAFSSNFKLELNFSEIDCSSEKEAEELSTSYWTELICALDKCPHFLSRTAELDNARQLLVTKPYLIDVPIGDNMLTTTTQPGSSNNSPLLVNNKENSSPRLNGQNSSPSLGSIPPPPPELGVIPPPPPTNGGSFIPPPPPPGFVLSSSKKKYKTAEAEEVSKTKQLHWKPIKKVSSASSVWSQIDEVDESLIDLEKIEMLFAKQAKNDEDDMSTSPRLGSSSTIPSPRTKVSPRQQQKSLATEGIIDAKSARNIEIIINSQFKQASSEQVVEAINNLNITALSAQQVENMEQFVSTSGDLFNMKAKLKGIDREELPKTDTFFLDVLSVEEVGTKLKLMKFMLNYPNLQKDLTDKIEKKRAAIRCITNCASFTKVLSYIHAIGSFMNRGKKRLEGEGFDLRILPKLVDTRSSIDKSMNLITYLVKVLEKDTTGSINFDQELVDAGVCTHGVTVTLANVSQLLSEIQQQYKFIAKAVDDINKEKCTEDYKTNLITFFKTCQEEYPKMMEAYESLQKEATTCYEFYHFELSDDGSDRKLVEDEFFAIISEFVTQYRKAKESVIKSPRSSPAGMKKRSQSLMKLDLNRIDKR